MKILVEGIHWATLDDQSISDSEAKARGLPSSEYVELDEHDGDWSERGLEEQCFVALESKYNRKGVKPEVLWPCWP